MPIGASKRARISTFDELLDAKYGKKGSSEREVYEQGFDVFKIGVIIHELRKRSGMTQEQLAEKCGTTKNYISRIENNASDMRLATLQRIIWQGFGGTLRLSIET